jgi:cytochrome b involved in lipid metabolism
VIVVDNIVYDCTDFLSEHPGGEQVIKSFGGAECSWQFWRFHGKKEMEEFGRQLRVGRTEGLRNRFPEPKRYIGLRKLGDNEWD